MLVTIPGATGRLELTKIGNRVHIEPADDFDYTDRRNVMALTALAEMIHGNLVVPQEKSAVVAVPGGQTQQQIGTQVPQPGAGVPQLVTTEQLQQLMQPLQEKIQQLEQMVQQLMGGGSAAPPQQAAGGVAAPAAAPPVAPAPAPAQPQAPAPAAPAPQPAGLAG